MSGQTKKHAMKFTNTLKRKKLPRAAGRGWGAAKRARVARVWIAEASDLSIYW